MIFHFMGFSSIHPWVPSPGLWKPHFSGGGAPRLQRTRLRPGRVLRGIHRGGTQRGEVGGVSPVKNAGKHGKFEDFIGFVVYFLGFQCRTWEELVDLKGFHWKFGDFMESILM